MKSIKLLSVVAGIISIAQALSAQDADTSRWLEIVKDAEVVVSLDTKTVIDSLDRILKIQGIEKRYLLTWTRWKHTKPQKSRDGGSHTSALYEVKVDCKDRRFGIMSSTEYGEDSKAVLSERPTSVQMNRAAPESVDERMVEGICGYWKNRKKK